MAENFDLIFGQNASQQYAWNDTDYQNGWETIGNIPPTAAQFDALQRRSDTKMKELNDELTPLVNAETADNRQPSTAYSQGDIKYSPLLPTGWFLACTVSGMSSASELVVPSPVEEGDEITDGGVTWKIKKIGGAGDAGDGVPLGTILPLAHNSTLPAGYLLCDGSAVSRTMYPDLFSLIGTTYGAGDGSTTFNLPDYNAAERFVQGSATAGTVKQAGLPNITGETNYSGNNKFSIFTHGSSGSSGAVAWNDIGLNAAAFGSNYGVGALSFDASLSNPIYGASDTVQPNALTVRYIIKAFDGQTADSALIDVTQYAQELATKANRQLSNLDTANLACHVVVDSYYDSTTGDWWREYDDGWVEQGGRGSYPNGGMQTITFSKPFNDTKYDIQVSDISLGSSVAAGSALVDNLTTTGFDYFRSYMAGGWSNDIMWMACGMGAQS